MYLKSQFSQLIERGAIDERKMDSTFSLVDVYREPISEKSTKFKETKRTLAEVEMKYVSPLKMKNKVDL